MKKERMNNMGDIKKVLMEAGAGAGKTTTLVSLILDNIKSGIATPKEIIAITFTEAATAELKERFGQELLKKRDELEKTNNRNINEEKEYNNLKNAVNEMDSINISTIHGFCNKIFSESPFDVGYGIDRTVVTNREEDEFFDELYYKAVEEIDNKDLLDKLSYFDIKISELKNIFKEMFRKRDVDWKITNDSIALEEIKKIHREIISVFNEVKKEILRIKNGDDTIEGFTDSEWNATAYDETKTICYSSNLDEYMPYKYFDALRKTLKVSKSGDKHLEFIKKPQFAEQYLKDKADNTKKNYKKSTENIVSEVDNSISKYEYALKIILEQLLKQLYTKAWELRKESNLITNDDILYETHKLLEKTLDGDVIKKFDYKFCYIDEFQDTDPLQIEIFDMLGKLVSKTTTNNITFYFIGDPKQSIYRFRGADLDCYIQTKNEIQEQVDNKNPLYKIKPLPNNYRSGKPMLDFINEYFSTPNFFTNFEYKPMGIGRKEENSIYENDKDLFSGVYSYCTTAKSSDDGRIQDAKHIANMIYTLVKSKTRINTRGGVVRPLRYSDFMIITPKTSNQDFYINELKALGVGVNLQGRMEYTTRAINILKGVITHIIDNKNYGEVYILEAIYQKDYSDITDDEKNNANKVLSFISKYAQKRPISMLNNIDELVDIINSIADKPLDLSLLTQVIEELKTFPLPTFKDLETEFDKITSKNCERQLSLSSISDDVRIMNLHKSKGLQANVVILADAPSTFRNYRVHIEKDAEDHWYFEPYKKLSLSDSSFYKSPEIEEINADEKIKTAEEYKRLLYVAVTRAMEALIISGYEKTDKRTGKQSLEKGSYWAPVYTYQGSENSQSSFKDIDDFIKSYCSKQPALEITKECTNNSIAPGLTIAISDIDALKVKRSEIINPSRMDKTEKVISNENDNKDDESLGECSLNLDKVTTSSEDYALVPPLRGTVIHKIFECTVNYLKQNGSVKANRNTLINDSTLRNNIISYSVIGAVKTESEYSNNIRDVISKNKEELDRILLNYLNDDALMHSLETATEIYTEYPFEYISDKTESKTEITKGIIDLLLVFNNGDEIIYAPYDYKTNAKSESESTENFETSLKKEYAKQFELYENALIAISKTKNENATVQPTKLYHLY